MYHNWMKVINPCLKLISCVIVLLSLFFPFEKILYIYECTILFMVLLFSDIKIKEMLIFVYKMFFIIILTLIFINIYYEETYRILYFIRFSLIYLYFYVIIKSFSIYEFSKASSKVIDFFNFLSINIKKLRQNIYLSIKYIFVWYDYYKEYSLIESMKGIDYFHKGDIYKILFLFKNFKNIKKDSKKRIKEIKKDFKYRNYNYLQDAYKYSWRLKKYDYLFCILHINIIFLYVWRVRL